MKSIFIGSVVAMYFDGALYYKERNRKKIYCSHKIQFPYFSMAASLSSGSALQPVGTCDRWRDKWENGWRVWSVHADLHSNT